MLLFFTILFVSHIYCAFHLCSIHCKYIGYSPGTDFQDRWYHLLSITTILFFFFPWNEIPNFVFQPQWALPLLLAHENYPVLHWRQQLPFAGKGRRHWILVQSNAPVTTAQSRPLELVNKDHQTFILVQYISSWSKGKWEHEPKFNQILVFQSQYVLSH